MKWKGRRSQEEELRELCERRQDTATLQVNYLDSIVVVNGHILAAVAVDAAGNKLALGAPKELTNTR